MAEESIFEIAPIGFAILISLSFKIIIRGYFRSPNSFIASYAIPALIEPSPIIHTGTLESLSPFKAMALAAPTAIEIEVELCPATK